MGIFTFAVGAVRKVTETTNAVLFETNGRQAIEKAKEVAGAAFSSAGIETVGQGVEKGLEACSKLESLVYKTISISAQAGAGVVKAGIEARKVAAEKKAAEPEVADFTVTEDKTKP